MTTAADAAPELASRARQRYLASEAALWSANGLAPTEHWVEVASLGTRIRVLEVGSGEPILFVPGTGGTGPYWAPLVRELQDRRCLMIDRPGWGVSDPIDYRKVDFGRVAGEILGAVLDGFRLERSDMLGASIGALWALRCAQHTPQRVGRLVLIGGFPEREIPIPRFIKVLRSPIGALIVRLPMRPGMLRKQLEAIGHGETVERGDMDGFIAWRIGLQRDTRSMHHERDMVRAISGHDGFHPGITMSDADVSAIAAPTAMLFGTLDPTGSADLWHRFISRLPAGQLRLIPDAGHMPWWDDPEAVAAQVRAHLGRP
jgi:2-hydroxy-6-oxonona-2,4-dienedioate hydrolase